MFRTAAARSPWGCVAECESGGRWHLDTGNGFYGGLQFWQPAREEYGGLAYAGAPPGEQGHGRPPSDRLRAGAPPVIPKHSGRARGRAPALLGPPLLPSGTPTRPSPR
ncbi:transglycosylase family protein [Streptomyces sp. NPDC018693]|uniref:transglycosylase family protein n=1 Tax=unclassified Streptomyces TaxID=2593676 RepID=UPI0037A1AEEC